MVKKNKIKVLIVDDSFFMRKLLRDLLSASKIIEVVGEAKNGTEAIGKAFSLKPDIITMDFNMPGLNGAQVTEEILSKKNESLPAIIMLSAYTKEGREETFESLRSGAVDFIAKPSGELSLDINIIRDELIDKIKVASKARVDRHSKIETKFNSKKEKGDKSATEIIVIGSSTGGPPIVEDILSNLPEKLNAAILIAQHMPKHFTEVFSERLDKISPLKIKEAQEGDVIKEGSVFIAPGNHHTSVDFNYKKEPILKISEKKERKELCPSIDILMSSAADCYKDKTLGIILTGMGNDGTKGAEKIKSLGGNLIAQDPETAVINSMVNSVIEKKIVDEVLSPEEIIKKIIKVAS